MLRDSKVSKKRYNPPSLVVLDAGAVKEKLEAKGDLKDPVVQKMLTLADEQLEKRKPKSHAL